MKQREFSGEQKGFLIRMPPKLHAELEREARRRGVSLNLLATALLEEGLRRRADRGVGKK